MKRHKLMLAVVLSLCAGAVAAVTVEDFESWTGGGTAVADPENGSNTVLALAPGQAVEIDLPGTVGVVSMDVYDFGEAAVHPTTAYGPRWGVLGSDASQNPLSVAATIIYKTQINGSVGYGMGWETSQTGSWWSPSYFGGPRQCTLETWIDTDSDGVPDQDQNNGVGAWTTWRFRVQADGTAEIIAPFGAGGEIVKNAWYDSSAMAMENLAKAWFSGGRSGVAVGPVASGAYAGYSVLVDNVVFEGFDCTQTDYVDNFDAGWTAAAHNWRVATWLQNGTQMSTDRCAPDGLGHLVQTVLAGTPYCGGSMQSSVEYPYGRWVARVKPSPVSGVLNSMFSNDWDDMTTPGDYNDGTHFEVDIELLTYTFGVNSGEVHVAVHQGGSQVFYDDIELDFNPSDDYHLWGFDLYADHVDWHVDGRIFCTYANEAVEDFPSNYEMFFNAWTRDTWIMGPPTQNAYYLLDWVKFYSLVD